MFFQFILKNNLFFFIFFLSFISCSKTLTCPEGMTLMGKTCYVIEEIYEVKEVNVNPDIHYDENSADNNLSDSEIVDIIPSDLSESAETTANTKGIGSACIKDDQCEKGMVCLDWNMGYCTINDCDKCPDGSVCIALSQNTSVCLKKCSSDSECRVLEGYACKLLSTGSGKKESVCYEVKEPQAKIGDTCKDHSQCSGKSACLTNIPDGYCADLFCGNDSPCSEGSACVYFSGIPACLKICISNEDCKTEDQKERDCTLLKDYVTKKDVKVCTTSTTGLDFYAKCFNDFECDSKKCFLMFKGKCSFDQTGCLDNNSCKDGGFCMESYESYAGFCTQECGSSSICDEGFCVKDPSGASFCSLPCDDITDKKCRKDLEMTCMFGDPVGSNSKYVCARIANKGAGYKCSENGNCDSGECLKNDTGGYCLTACTGTGECPFPSSCQPYDNKYRCYLRCFHDKNCPSGFTCKTGPQTTVKICLP
jgi:hypothetical protein